MTFSRLFLVVLTMLLACEPSYAQYQIKKNSVPIGRGLGVGGFDAADPGVAGLPLVSNGVSPTAKPTFQAVPNTGIAVGPKNTAKGSVDGTTLTDVPFWTNVRLAKTTAYSAVTADCGSTVALGGSTFFTLTVSTASGYSATCVLVVLNEDSGRGKSVSVAGYTPFVLWPGQTATIYNQNNTWQISKPNRWRLPADTAMYVGVTGCNDANDGLNVATPLCTLQKAWDNAADLLDFGGHYLTYNIANGTYAGVATQKGVIDAPYLGLIFIGNQATPSSVVVSSSGVAPWQVFEAGGPVSFAIKGMQLRASGGADCVFVGSALVYGAGYNIDFNQCAGVGIRAYNCAEFDMLGNFTISGSPGAGIFAFVNANAIISWQGITVTLIGTPNFPTGFANAQGGQIIPNHGNTYTGASTGVRCVASNLGLVDTGGLYASLPGTTGCTPSGNALTSTGGYIL